MSDAVVKIGVDDAELRSGINRALGHLKKMDKAVAGLGRDIAGTIFGGAMLSFTKDSIQAAAALEGYKNSLAIVMGGAEAAAVEMEKLREAALLPGLDFENLIKGSQRFQTLGFSADEARKILVELGNVSAVSGLSKFDFAEIIDSIIDMGSAGEITDEKVDRLTERSAMFSKVMKEQFGASTAKQLRELGVSADEFIKKLAEGLSGIERAAGDSLANQLKNSNEQILQLKDSIGTQLTPAVTTALQSFDKFLTSASRGWESIEKQLTVASAMLAGMEYDEAVEGVLAIYEAEKKALEATKKRAEAQQKAADAAKKASESNKPVKQAEAKDVNKLKDSFADLDGLEAEAKRAEENVREMQKALGFSLDTMRKIAAEKGFSVFNEKQIEIANELAKALKNQKDIQDKINKEAKDKADDAKEAAKEQSQITAAREQFAIEQAILELRNEGTRAASKQADEMERQQKIAELAQDIMERQELSYEEAIKLAERRANAEDKASGKSKRPYVQGYTEEMRKNSKYSDPNRELNKYKNRGKSQFEELQDKKFGEAFSKPKAAKDAMSAKDRQNAKEAKVQPNVSPIERSNEILGQLLTTLQNAVA